MKNQTHYISIVQHSSLISWLESRKQTITNNRISREHQYNVDEYNIYLNDNDRQTSKISSFRVLTVFFDLHYCCYYCSKQSHFHPDYLHCYSHHHFFLAFQENLDWLILVLQFELEQNQRSLQ